MEKKRRLKKGFRRFLTLLVITGITVTCIFTGKKVKSYLEIGENNYYFTLKAYKDKDFNYKSVRSGVDRNKNGIDDTMDLVYAARRIAHKHPVYKDAFYGGGYPPEDEGVCTDMIWRSLKALNIDFKSLIDEDIASYPTLYSRVQVHGKALPDIDFRRVPNIKSYLTRHAKVLTTDIEEKETFQAGDIVVFNEDHVAIISDYRDKEGYPYIIHHSGVDQVHMEEDVLVELNASKPITGHFRYQF